MRTHSTTGPRTRWVPSLLLCAAALVVGITGTATAALISGDRSKDGTVTGRDLRDGTVGGVDVRNGSLSTADAPDARVGPDGPAGPDGPVGPAGPAGPVGAQGLPGVRGLQYRTGEPFALPPGTFNVKPVYCPAGTKALGGGLAVTGGLDKGRLLESAPLDNGVGWQVGLYNDSSVAIDVYPWVVCAVAS